MNAERLHVIAIAVRDEMRETNIENTLQNLVNSLDNLVKQPQQPQFQQEVANYRGALQEALANSASNEFSASWRQALQELGVEGLLGENLGEGIEEIFERNEITPTVALNDIRELHTKINELSQALDQLISAFEYLEIGAEELEPGEFELGVLVPRAFVDNNLKDFGKELSELNRIFGTFSELATGSRPDFGIRSVSSSDFTVYLDLLPEVAVCIALAVERVVATYKNMLEIRKHQQGLKDQSVPDESLKGLKEYLNSLMEKEIGGIVKDLLKEYGKSRDDGRRNELDIELRLSLRKIANRVDKGYNIAVRVEPIREAAEDDELSAKERKQLEKKIGFVQSTAETLQFMKLHGNPILSLPESEKKQKKKVARKSLGRKRK